MIRDEEFDVHGPYLGCMLGRGHRVPLWQPQPLPSVAIGGKHCHEIVSWLSAMSYSQRCIRCRSAAYLQCACEIREGAKGLRVFGCVFTKHECTTRR